MYLFNLFIHRNGLIPLINRWPSRRWSCSTGPACFHQSTWSLATRLQLASNVASGHTPTFPQSLDVSLDHVPRRHPVRPLAGGILPLELLSHHGESAGQWRSAGADMDADATVNHGRRTVPPTTRCCVTVTDIRWTQLSFMRGEPPSRRIETFEIYKHGGNKYPSKQNTFYWMKELHSKLQKNIIISEHIF